MAGRRRGRYPPEYKERIVELVRAGRSPGSVGREFEPSELELPRFGGRSGLRAAYLTGQIRGPIVHEPTPPLEQIRPPVRRLDLVLHDVSQRRLDDLQGAATQRYPVLAGGLHRARCNRPHTLLPVDLAPHRPTDLAAPRRREHQELGGKLERRRRRRFPHGLDGRRRLRVPRGARVFPERRRSSPPRPAPSRCAGRRAAPDCEASSSREANSRHPARFCPTTRLAASAKVGIPTERRCSASGSPPARASLRLASACSRASANETRATLPSPISRFRPRMTSR